MMILWSKILHFVQDDILEVQDDIGDVPDVIPPSTFPVIPGSDRASIPSSARLLGRR